MQFCNIIANAVRRLRCNRYPLAPASLLLNTMCSPYAIAAILQFICKFSRKGYDLLNYSYLHSSLSTYLFLHLPYVCFYLCFKYLIRCFPSASLNLIRPCLIPSSCLITYTLCFIQYTLHGMSNTLSPIYLSSYFSYHTLSDVGYILGFMPY